MDNKLEKNECIKELNFEIKNKIFGQSMIMDDENFIITFLALCDKDDSYKKLVDNNEKLREIITKYENLYLKEYKDKLKNFTIDELKNFILYYNTESREYTCHTTPDCLNKLALKILDIKKEDNVLELCSGSGGFPIVASANGIEMNYKGIEYNYRAYNIAMIRNAILCLDSEFEICDAIEYKSDNKSDKIFSNYPFGTSVDINKNFDELIEYFDFQKDIFCRKSGEWLFNTKLIEQLSENGKAVAIMRNGSAWDKSSEKVRTAFVEKGFVETVISLPDKLFKDTIIPTIMIVFSFNNKNIRMIDARNLFVNELRWDKKLSDENIDEIISCISKDCEYSLSVSNEEVAKNEYILNPISYFETVPEFDNGVEFGGLIKKITRGSQIKLSEFEEYKTKEPTLNQYVTLTNIEDGNICFEDDGQYLSNIPEKLEKCCITNNSIILSKIGTPMYKSAVVRVDGNKKIIANGNLFIIEIDEEKVDPYYLQALFSSKIGNVMLKNISTGSCIQTISVDKLKKMIIPFPSLEKQKEIGNKFAATLDEIVLIKRKLKNAINKLDNIFSEEG